MRTWQFRLPAIWLAAGFPLLSLFQVNPLLSQPTDWLTWRGPSANGSITDNTLTPNSFQTVGRVLWQTNVGTGHSAVAVQGNRVYTMGNREDAGENFSDQVVCLDAETGRLIWQVSYPMKELEDPGPFSTPAVDGSRVYTLSRGGKLSCFDALTGSCLWENDLVTRNLTSAEAEFACSPLIVGDMVILNVNERGLALNKLTGQPVWTSAPGKNAVSTSVLFPWRGRTCVTMQTDTDKTFALDPATGEVLWSVPESYIPDPLFTGNRMILFSYKGCSVYDLSQEPPRRIWNEPLLKTAFQSFICRDGFFYGFINQGGEKLMCIETASGTIRWQQKMAAGSLIEVNGTLVVIDKSGYLHFVEATPENYTELAGTQVIEMAPTDAKGRGYRRICACWTNPVYADHKLYIRNSYGELVCLEVR